MVRKKKCHNLRKVVCRDNRKNRSENQEAFVAGYLGGLPVHTLRFRFNVLTEQAEYNPKGKATFKLVDQRTLNTLCIETRGQGINCCDKDVSRLMTATEIFCRLQKKFPSALRNSNANQMGKALQAIGVKSVHTRMGNSYCVVSV